MLDHQNIGHLIIDLRSNGGGSVTNSTLITRYLAKARFRIADTLYAIRKKGPWSSYIRNHFWNRLFMTVFTRKRKDGFFHFGYYERHAFRPKRKHHFDGQVYLLTGGNTFSAATLMAVSLVRQENVTIVGEETGGGAHGNSAWLIPDAELPQTGVRFRLPLFRLVIDRHFPHDGRGLMPEVPSIPTIEGIRRNTDFKVEKTMELIRAAKQKTE
jgi:C-terminal processing protease CtpA/Prc